METVNTGSILLLIAMTMIGAIAGLFLKKASALDSHYAVMFSPWFYAGGALYFLSALINIYILRLLPYSTVLPLTSITYVWTMLLAYLVLHERITYMKMLGVACIFLGTASIGLL